MADAGGWDEQTRRAAATYGSAADHFDRPALGFWDRFGATTVARLSLAPGHEVADLCCGAGASALPAARAVAPGGRVLAIDVAAPLLELARVRAARDGVHNVEFRLGDATSTGLADASFDVVLSVFGVFFAADMPGFVREMWRLVRPGGTLAVTTWGPDLFEPGTSVFWEEVGRSSGWPGPGPPPCAPTSSTASPPDRGDAIPGRCLPRWCGSDLRRRARRGSSCCAAG